MREAERLPSASTTIPLWLPPHQKCESECLTPCLSGRFCHWFLPFAYKRLSKGNGQRDARARVLGRALNKAHGLARQFVRLAAVPQAFS